MGFDLIYISDPNIKKWTNPFAIQTLGLFFSNDYQTLLSQIKNIEATA